MEKEFNIEIEQMSCNFFYESFDLSKSELLNYEKTLNLVLKSMDWFFKEHLKLSAQMSFNLNLCSDNDIIQLNLDYRNKNSVTDVLSFPMQEDIRNGDMDMFASESTNQLELGDIFICHSVCEKQAAEFDISYSDEFIHLLIHGFLHLCGYDHEESEDEEKIMESFEKLLIDHI